MKDFRIPSTFSLAASPMPSTSRPDGELSRPRGSRGGLVWPGLLRRLDRIDPSYRT